MEPLYNHATIELKYFTTYFETCKIYIKKYKINSEIRVPYNTVTNTVKYWLTIS